MARRGLNEATLRDFFLGKISSCVLGREAEEAVEQLDAIRSNVYIHDMDTTFEVTREMALWLCEAAIDGGILPNQLRAIGFMLQASDRFEWDAARDPVLSAVFDDWAFPEISSPLTSENLGRCKRRLLGLEPYPVRPTLDPPTSRQGRLTSRVEKKWF
jgi:hypothetical protein